MVYTTTNAGVIFNSLGAVIPQDEDNADYQNYLLWLSAGNEPQTKTEETKPAPDWLGFYVAFQSSSVYAGLTTLASENSVINLSLIPFMSVLANILATSRASAALKVTFNALNQALLNTGNALTSKQTKELEGLLATYNLTEYFN